jgi:hypothetical protein
LGSTTPAAVSATTLTTSSTVTLNGGTANGVAYLNGSKVVTSGSALTFDGTNLGVGVNSRSVSGYSSFGVNGSTGGLIDLYSGGTRVATFGADTTVAFGSVTNIPVLFTINNSEQMRLTSTGLGIGTSSPALKLDVTFSSAGDGIRTYNTLSTGYADVRVGNNSNNNLGYLRVGGSAQGGISQDSFVVGTAGGYPIKIAPQNTVAATFDTAGNLGLGVTPSAWLSTVAALQMKNGACFYGQPSGSSGDAGMSANQYINTSGNRIYIANGYATFYDQKGDSGVHRWFNAPSGTAGNAITFTQAMTLDASGNLGVGTTSSLKAVTSASNTSTNYQFTARDTRSMAINVGGGIAFEGNDGSLADRAFGAIIGAKENATSGNYAGYLAFYSRANGSGPAEAARIDSSGNMGLGTTSPNIDGGTARALTLNSASSGARLELASGGTRYGQFFAGSSGAFITAFTAIPLVFEVNGSERARIDSSGNLLVGTTSNAPAGTQAQLVNKWSGGSKWGASFDQTVSSATQYTHINFSTNGTTVGYINANNAITTYNSVSDYRLKTVIGAVSGSGERIDALEPIEYEWKVDGSRTRGFLAHKFQEVYAGSVSGDKDAVNAEGNPVYQAMQAGSAEVIADLVAEIQSLRKRLADAGI